MQSLLSALSFQTLLPEFICFNLFNKLPETLVSKISILLLCNSMIHFFKGIKMKNKRSNEYIFAHAAFKLYSLSKVDNDKPFQTQIAKFLLFTIKSIFG